MFCTATSHRLNVPTLVPRLNTRAVPCSAAAATEALQTPHGGKLVDLMVSNVDAAIQSCTKTVECNDRQACDVELLSVGCASTLWVQTPSWCSCSWHGDLRTAVPVVGAGPNARALGRHSACYVHAW